jgi:nucleoside 2-deoxyribosyltransferase
MKIYLTYKLSGADKEKLKNELEKISQCLENIGYQTFIFYRDMNKWGEIEISPDKILEKAFREIKNSDIVFVFLDKIEKSEGMLLELGYAKALNKKIILAIQKDIPKFYFTKSLSDMIIEFDNLENLIEKIKLNLQN